MHFKNKAARMAYEKRQGLLKVKAEKAKLEKELAKKAKADHLTLK